jgi:hypothetical protein
LRRWKSINENKIILDLRGGTVAWSKPSKDAGYDVRLITLPESDVRNYELPENVYGIGAATPLHNVALARTRSKTPRRNGNSETVEACLRIIWTCRKRGKIAFWALGNPVWFPRQFLGKPPFTFRTSEFGDLIHKPTDIWGYFAAPVKFANPC